jgi:hypothetical protein
MNYKSWFRFLIIFPMALIVFAVALDFSYPFPESVSEYYALLAAGGFSRMYYAYLLVALAAFIADMCLFFFVKNSREIWLILISVFYVIGALMPELTIMSPASIVMVQVASLLGGIKITVAYYSPQIRDLL